MGVEVSSGWTARALATALLVLGLASAAEAQRRAAPGGANARFAEAEEMLAAADADAIRMGLEILAEVGGARAVTPIAARIQRGLPPDVLASAIDTLSMLARPEAGPVLFELLSHRRAEVRAQAAQAIVAVRARGGDRALTAALSDANVEVRRAAAIGLGQLGARDAAPQLFVALERGLLEAAPALGQVVTPDDVDRVLTFLGRVPFDALFPAFDELFARRDIPERVKLAIIARLEGLATPEVKTYLTELADALPDGAIRRAATAAAERITG
ncbi:MAG: hypothetical protein KF901_13560 [Myxococcales bacterium]|nr:hypothetical protein [Myxococcales bacterium]